MARIHGTIVLVFVVVCTALPFLFMEKARVIIQQFGNLSNKSTVFESQVFFYSIARLCSFIFLDSLQLKLLEKGLVYAVVVVTFGETLGQLLTWCAC